MTYIFRVDDKEITLNTRSKVKLCASIIIIASGLIFGISAQELFDIAKVFKENYKIETNFTPDDMVRFFDPAPKLPGMTYFSIDKTDLNSLEVGKPIRLHAYITTQELPKELVVHIYHENMKDFFAGTSDTDYRGLATSLGRVPALRYGDAYNIQFDLKTPKNQDHYDLNGNQTMTFTTPGYYLAQISEKNSTNQILHYQIPGVVLTVRDYQLDWMSHTLESIGHSIEDQTSARISAFGMSYLAIGIGVSLSGVNLLFSNLDWNVRRENEQKDDLSKGVKL